MQPGPSVAKDCTVDLPQLAREEDRKVTAAVPLSDDLAARKQLARAWFEALRDEICNAFETVERELPPGAPLADQPAGRFERTPWQRADHTGKAGGGGLMSMMTGRVFDQVTFARKRRKASYAVTAFSTNRTVTTAVFLVCRLRDKAGPAIVI